MKLVIGSDHGGFELKELIKKHFKDIEFVDVGAHSTDSVDYPDVIAAAAKKVQSGEVEKGIILCGSGIGASMTANRFQGVRAALIHDDYGAEMCRRHNDANLITLGGRIIAPDMAFRFIDIFLKTPFDGGRHEIRVKKIDEVSR